MNPQRILRNILVSVGMLFALPQLLAAATFTTFDVPGAGTGPGEGTQPQVVTPAGVIAGAYYDANFVSHGFVRARGGTTATFDPPGAVYT